MTKIALLVVAVICGVGLAGSYSHVDGGIFFRGYLIGFLFALGLGLGSLALIMLHNLTGGAWGNAIRPVVYAGTKTLPLLAILFIPIAFHLAALYPWARSGGGADELIAHRAGYFGLPFFFGRAAFYFVTWIILGGVVLRNNGANRGLNGFGLVFYLWTMTHASWDWILSRDTDFYSTAFGFVVTLGQVLAAMAFAVVVLGDKADRPSDVPGQSQRPSLFNDLGNILLTLVILWMYVSFMQFLVVWMGNTHEDQSYYLQRGVGNSGGNELAWQIIGGVIIVFHFFVPFYILLFRRAKQWRTGLKSVAWILLAAHVVEQFWLVAPGDKAAAEFDPAVTDVLWLVGLMAVWVLVFLVIRDRQDAVPPLQVREEEAAHA